MPFELSDNARTIALQVGNGKMVLWDLNNNRLTSELIHGSKIVSVCFSPIKNEIAVGSETGSILIWDYDRQLVLTELNRDENFAILALAFSPDGKYLGIGQSSGGVIIYDREKLQIICEIEKKNTIIDVVFPNENEIIYSTEHEVVSFNFRNAIQTFKIARLFFRPELGSHTISLILPLKQLACLEEGSIIQLYDFRDGKHLRNLVPNVTSLYSHAETLTSDKQKYLFVAGSHGGLYIWNLETYTLVSSCTIRGSQVRPSSINRTVFAFYNDEVFSYNYSNLMD